MTDIRHNTDGTTTVTFSVPAPPDWNDRLDAARQRLYAWERQSDWHFTSLSEPSHSYGYICVMEKPGITHSMSGSCSMASVVAGFGSTWEAAIDDAIGLAKARDESHGKSEEARGYVDTGD